MLLDKTGSHRIGYAMSTSDLTAVNLAKARFEGLDYNETTFGEIKESWPNTKRYECEIELTGRDGFKFKQVWCPADVKAVLKDKASYQLPNMDELNMVVRPGLYFVTDVAELWVVALSADTVEEIKAHLGYIFEQNDLVIEDNTLSFSSEIVEGSLPMIKLVADEHGKVSDGSHIRFYAQGTPVVNPHDQPIRITVEHSGQETLVSKDVKVTFKEGPLKDQVFQGTLGNDNLFTFEVELDYDSLNKTSSALIQVGLTHDEYDDFGAAEIKPESWEITLDGDVSQTQTIHVRAADPDVFTGNVQSSVDPEIKPWGTSDKPTGVFFSDDGERVGDVLENGSWECDIGQNVMSPNENRTVVVRPNPVTDDLTIQVVSHGPVSVEEVTIETQQPDVDIDLNQSLSTVISAKVENQNFPYEWPDGFKVVLRDINDDSTRQSQTPDEYGNVEFTVNFDENTPTKTTTYRLVCGNDFQDFTFNITGKVPPAQPSDIVVDEAEGDVVNAWIGETNTYHGHLSQAAIDAGATRPVITFDGVEQPNDSADDHTFEFVIDGTHPDQIVIDCGVTQRTLTVGSKEVKLEFTNVSFPETADQNVAFTVTGKIVYTGPDDHVYEDVSVTDGNGVELGKGTPTGTDHSFSIQATATKGGANALYLETESVKAGPYTVIVRETPKVTTVTATADKASAETDTNVVITGTVKDQTGKVMAGENLSLMLAGEVVETKASNASGKVTFTVTSADAGKLDYTVKAGAVTSAVVSVTWTLPAPKYTKIEVVSGATTGETGTEVLIKVVTKDQYGNPMANQTIVWNNGGIPFPVTHSDANGELTVRPTSETEGKVTYTFAGDSGVTKAVHEITWTAPAPVFSDLVITHGDLEVEAGQDVAFTVKTVDQYGEPMADQEVIYYDGKLTYPARRSDPNGIVSYTFNEAEAKSITYAFIGGGARKEYTVTWTAVVADPVYTALTIVSGPTEGTVGTPVEVVVSTVDQNGDPMPNQTIVWDDGGIPFPVTSSGADGTKTFQLSRDAAESVTYEFAGGNSEVMSVTHTINWTA
ncbi:hypothetical protein [Vibrio phage VP4B]|uniref:Big-1 domain-containing protein n=1 Tax=Vibrio phage VP4B TaxID=1262540 RepID=V9M0D4_9CAUD|nr:hypothetical protein FDJ61_gp187 [Vibrio phage VP4B]AGB07301.1 hypothetical protein [Vibrio phage VP4B]